MNEVAIQSATQRTVSRAIILSDGHCLVQHKRTEERGDYYGLPGGAREPFETLIEALQREAREEIGSSLVSPQLIGVADYRRRDDAGLICDHVECLFAARLPEGYEPRNGPRPDRNQRGVIWLSLEAVATADFSPPFVRDVILRLAEGEPINMGYLGAYADPRLETTAGV